MKPHRTVTYTECVSVRAQTDLHASVPVFLCIQSCTAVKHVLFFFPTFLTTEFGQILSKEGMHSIDIIRS